MPLFFSVESIPQGESMKVESLLSSINRRLREYDKELTTESVEAQTLRASLGAIPKFSGGLLKRPKDKPALLKRDKETINALKARPDIVTLLTDIWTVEKQKGSTKRIKERYARQYGLDIENSTKEEIDTAARKQVKEEYNSKFSNSNRYKELVELMNTFTTDSKFTDGLEETMDIMREKPGKGNKEGRREKWERFIDKLDSEIDAHLERIANGEVDNEDEEGDEDD